MRLAVVSLMSGQPWGGSEALWYSLAEYALQKGDKVFASLYQWEPEPEKIKALREKGAEISLRKRFNNNAGLTEKIIRFLKKRRPAMDKDYQSIIDFKPDHIFISQGDNFDLALHHKALYRLIMRKEIPYSFVCHAHAQYGALPPREIYPEGAEVFKNAQHVFFVSKNQQRLTERKLICRLENGRFTWNPLPFSIPSEALPWPADDVIHFAVIGDMIGGKGHDTLLEVLNEPQWQSRNYRLNIYGKGEAVSYLKSLANYYGIEDHVIFHGYVSDIRTVWALNQMLVIPSATEGLPISLVEAMASGRTVTATDVGGISELIENGVSGFIAAAPSVKYLSKAMEEAWRKKDEWKQMGNKAFDTIKEVFPGDPVGKLYDIILPGIYQQPG